MRYSSSGEVIIWNKRALSINEGDGKWEKTKGKNMLSTL